MSVFSNVNDAASWLMQGKILAYPTESVWGIGCDAMNERAVQQILQIKNRPIEKGMIVITDSIDRIKPLLKDLTPTQHNAIATSWQSDENDSTLSMTLQATTWLLPIPHDISIPSWITGKYNTVAVRVIAHREIQKLCTQMVSKDNPFGFIISTSCNPSTLPPAQSIEQAQKYFSEDYSDDMTHGSLVKEAQVAYLVGETLGYTLPSHIKDAIHGGILR